MSAVAWSSAIVHADQTAGGTVIAEPELTESSGLAVSHRNPHRFWTHNDSGGKSRIYAFDQDGRPSGQCQLRNIDAGDWEDIASFVQHDRARLLIADCGDNDAKRESVSLHLIDEPDPDAASETTQIQTLSLTYPGGPRDCEAVAVDSRRKLIILISKSRLPAASVHVVALPPPTLAPQASVPIGGEKKNVPATVSAKRVATLPLPMITAVDIDPRSGDLWLVSYFQAFQFRCASRDEPLTRQLGRLPRAYDLPHLKQIESVAVGQNQRVWVTSEGIPAILAAVETNP
jgi:hypothetical protein